MWPDIDDLEDLESSVIDGLEAIDDRSPEGTSSLERARRLRAADPGLPGDGTGCHPRR